MQQISTIHFRVVVAAKVRSQNDRLVTSRRRFIKRRRRGAAPRCSRHRPFEVTERKRLGLCKPHVLFVGGGLLNSPRSTRRFAQPPSQPQRRARASSGESSFSVRICLQHTPCSTLSCMPPPCCNLQRPARRHHPSTVVTTTAEQCCCRCTFF